MNRLRIIFITIAFGLLSLTGMLSKAQTPAQAYATDDYENAIRLWEAELAGGTISSELYYNLGNAYFKTGNNGAAVLNYEKSLRLDPSNKDTRNNLKVVEAQVQLSNEALTGGKNLDPSPATPGIVTQIEQGIASWSSNQWAVCAAVFFVIVLACVVLYIFFSNVKLRKIGFFGGISALILCAVAIYFSVISKRSTLSKQTCVVMTENLSLHSKPEAESEAVATPLSQGTVLTVMGSEKSKEGIMWTNVYLNTEYSGWVPATDIAIVSLPGMEE